MNDELDLRGLAAKAVLDIHGRSRQLGSLWRNQPAVLVWLRHFGCLFCKEQASELRRERDTVAGMGARLAFVGHGGVAYARAFHDEFVPNCAVFTDPSAYTYRELGANDGVVGTVAGFGVHGFRALRRGHFQTSIQGRPFQQGGVLIALPGDLVAWVYRSRLAGDHPPNAEVLERLRSAVDGRSLEAAPPAAWRPIPEMAPPPVPPASPPPPIPTAMPAAAAAPRYTWSPPPPAGPASDWDRAGRGDAGVA